MPRPIRFGSDALLYCAGDKADKIFLLNRGRVLLTHVNVETGAETADIVEPGEFFGIKPVLGKFPREENALAKESATVIAFTLSEFEALMLSNERVIMKMLKVFSNQLRRVHSHISSITKTQYVKSDYALFEIGENYMKTMRYSQAKYIFDRYMELYPEGENAQEVMEQLWVLKKTQPPGEQSRASAGAQSGAKFPDGEGGAKPGPGFLTRFSRGFKPGEIIFSEHEPGNTFYLVQSGEVRLTKNTGKYEHTLDILRKSELFGEMAILDKSPRTASAVAVDEVTLLEFTGENFEILMRGYPQIAIKLLRVFSTRIHNAKRRVMILTLPDPQTKVADVFLMLDETGKAAGEKTGGYSREFKVTAGDIAHWAGLEMTETKAALDYYVVQRRISVYADRMVIKNINDFSRLVASRRYHG